jgi:hypothetical protein
MRISFTLFAIVATLGMTARAEDAPLNTSGPALLEGTQGAIMMPMDATAAPVEAAPLMPPPALPHYYGRGEWPGYGCNGGCGYAPHSGCSTCDNATWGCCPRPRTYHMHLWDSYCYETTRCPCCGCGLGSLWHYMSCERGECSCLSECGWDRSPCCNSCGRSSISDLLGRLNFGHACGCNGCAQGGCAARSCEAEAPAKMPGKAPHMVDDPVPPPPTMDKTPGKATDGAPAKPEGKKDMPATKESARNGKDTPKTSRAAAVPSNASLLDRLLPWRSRGTR